MENNGKTFIGNPPAWRAPAIEAHACNCIGPQNNEPKCPCMMRGVVERDGRWIETERDLGPVLKSLHVPSGGDDV